MHMQHMHMPYPVRGDTVMLRPSSLTACWQLCMGADPEMILGGGGFPRVTLPATTADRMRVRECASNLSESECGTVHCVPKGTLVALNIDHPTWSPVHLSGGPAALE